MNLAAVDATAAGRRQHRQLPNRRRTANRDLRAVSPRDRGAISAGSSGRDRHRGQRACGNGRSTCTAGAALDDVERTEAGARRGAAGRSYRRGSGTGQRRRRHRRGSPRVVAAPLTTPARFELMEGPERSGPFSLRFFRHGGPRDPATLLAQLVARVLRRHIFNTGRWWLAPWLSGGQRQSEPSRSRRRSHPRNGPSTLAGGMVSTHLVMGG